MRLTSDQFDALAELLRLRDSTRTQAARLMLVDGLTRDEAMAATGTSRQNVEAAVASCERGLELARRVVSK